MLTRQPMVWFAVCFAVGALLGRALPAAAALGGPLAGAAVLLLAAGLLGSRRRAAAPLPLQPTHSPLVPVPGWIARFGSDRVLLAIGLFCLGLGLWRQGTATRLAREARASLPVRFQATVVVDDPPEEGLATDEPGGWRHASGRVLLVDGRRVEPVPVRLAGWGRPDVERGDQLRGRLWREPLRVPAFPGTFDYAHYLETRGLVAAVRFCKQGDGTQPAYTITRARMPSLRRCLDRVRKRAVRGILGAVPGRAGQFLAAATFGYRVDLDRDMRQSFQRVGIGHVLAISGLHVGLIASLLWGLLSLLTGDRRKLALACIPLLLAYLALSGMRTPAIRATVMITIYMLGFVLVRRSHFLNSLGAAALLLLFATPASVVNLGFQLSFVAVIFISQLGGLLDRALGGAGLWGPEDNAAGEHSWWAERNRRLRLWARGLVLVSVAAWVGVTPLIATAFHRVNPIGLVSNLVALPLMTVVLAGGMALPLVSLLPSALSQAVAPVTVAPAEGLIAFADTMRNLPLGSIPVAPPAGWAMLAYYGMFLLLFLSRAEALRGRARQLAWVSLGGILAAAGFMIVSMSPGAPPRRTRLTLLPASSSEIVIVETASGEVAAIGRISRKGRDLAEFLHVRRRGMLHAVVGLRGERHHGWKGLTENVRTGVIACMPLSRTPSPSDDPPPADDPWASAPAAPGSTGIFAAPANASATPHPALGAHSGWQPIPEVAGVEVALSYDQEGKLTWWAVRADGLTAGVGEWCWPEQLAYRVGKRFAGTESLLASLRIRGRDEERALAEQMPARWAFLAHRTKEDDRRPGQHARAAYGALELSTDRWGRPVARGYDGEEWRNVPGR